LSQAILPNIFRENIMSALTIVNRRMERLESDILELKTRMNESFTYSFEWGLQEDIYKKMNLAKHYEQASQILELAETKELALEWLGNRVNTITEDLLTGKQFESSSCASSNLAYTLRRQVTVEFLPELKRIIRDIVSGDDEIR
jgi:hypothetical protein